MTAGANRPAEKANVAVVGLGEMGGALAATMLDAGHSTTVWNRTPEKADALVRRGARPATTVRDAVTAAELVIVSVKGNANTRDLLTSAGDILAGRAVLNLTDGTSAEARDVADHVAKQGAAYLHGQIMTIAPGIGHPDAVVFYGGPHTVYDRYRNVLNLLGGRGSLISDDAGVPALYGMAVHDTMWGTLNGFLHAAELLESEGIEAKRFLDQASASISALLGFLPAIAEEADRAEHGTEYGALKHHLPSVDDLVRESQARGIDDEFPSYTLSLVKEAMGSGHSNDSYSRLIDHFRKVTR
jgi:3-hydroxyisobutyrate dehydrogenase-like beta-hydroxyacid dehydrogenase